jgi:hypothetical protein
MLRLLLLWLLMLLLLLLQAAWEFAGWAFKTPEQRARELRLAALVQVGGGGVEGG